MLKKVKISTLLFLFFLPPYFLFAQTTEQHCGTTFSNQYQSLQNQAVFENWMQSKIAKKTSQISKTQEETYQIAVVVHVIHKGEAVGVGSNISLAQIESQIRILNEDFRRKTGTNGYNTNPLGADVNIEFSLATTSPQSTSTDGIVRINGIKNTWSLSDNVSLKSLSYWNAEEYLNIWVCDLSGFLGYAQFPESDLQGLSIQKQNPLLDGVVVDYLYFGDINTRSPFNLGRTATHEVGHFLGLRHIWGDETNCLGTDYCGDTPVAFQENTGCPSSPRRVCDANKPEMIQNYMDYTNDACMNIFTVDQKTRMRAVLENCPRRKSLLTSPGIQPVVVTANDAGIERITTLQNAGCTFVIRPMIVVRNYGSAVLNTISITLSIDGKPTSTILWTGSLASLERVSLTLPESDITAGKHEIKINTSNPNNTTDLNTANDGRMASLEIEAIQSVPFTENFQTDTLGVDSKWKIINADYATTWSKASVTTTEQSTNAMCLRFFDYKSAGAQDYLISPPIDLSKQNSYFLTFDVSYSSYINPATKIAKQDALKVLLSTDCGQTFNTVLYEKSGTVLATDNTAKEAWIPTLTQHWRREKIELSAWAGNPALKIAFVGVNDFGNNLYIDNVSVQSGNDFSGVDKSVNIYPNPNRGFFYIDFNLDKSTDVDIQVFQLSGGLLYKKNYPSTQKNIYTVDLPDLQKGVFIVNISGDGINISKKIVIE